MMYKYTFKQPNEAIKIEEAVEKTLQQGYRTADIMDDNSTKIGCEEMGDRILGNL